MLPKVKETYSSPGHNDDASVLAPIIFSHSGARAIGSNPRNVPDDVLERVAEVGGVVMVNFYACFLIDNCGEEDATVLDVVKHINHIR